MTCHKQVDHITSIEIDMEKTNEYIHPHQVFAERQIWLTRSYLCSIGLASGYRHNTFRNRFGHFSASEYRESESGNRYN